MDFVNASERMKDASSVELNCYAPFTACVFHLSGQKLAEFARTFVKIVKLLYNRG